MESPSNFEYIRDYRTKSSQPPSTSMLIVETLTVRSAHVSCAANPGGPNQ